MATPTITIDQETREGNRIKILDGKVFVNGLDVTPKTKELNVFIKGDVYSMEVDGCNNISVKGDADDVTTQSGDVDVKGHVNGSVKTVSGNINCAEVKGSVSTESGNIKCKR